MRGRARLAILAAACLAGPGTALAQPPELEPLAVLYRGTAIAELQGREIPVPYSVTEAGPRFALAPLIRVMGGELETGPKGLGFTLRVGEAEFLLGPDSRALVVDREIHELSQPPAVGEGGLQVPLDLLRSTYGERLGYGFEWRSSGERLLVDRQRARLLPMEVDAVHLRRMTTVVLQFPERPRYRITEEDGGIEVEFLGDRVELRGPLPRLEGDLVRDLRVHPGGVRLELDAGAAADSYELTRPFRLVFDIHRGGGTPSRRPAADSGPQLSPPTPVPGIHTIVIDPGHGGSESGAVGSGGAVEKELTLTLAQTLKRRLEQRLPVRVVLTREEDAHLPLETRTAIANENKGDLFISLHLNSSLGNRAQGAETYFLSNQASDPQAARSAEVENRSAGGESAGEEGGSPLYDLQLILWDLAQSQYLAESQRLANLIQEELNGALGLKDRGVKQAPFRVLMGAAMPAVLVEFGFLSNPSEEAKLQDPAHRADLVEALVRAVTRYRAQLAQRRDGADEVLK